MKTLFAMMYAFGLLAAVPSMAQTNVAAWPQRIYVVATNESQYGIRVAVSHLLTTHGQKRVDVTVPVDRGIRHVESISLQVEAANLFAPLALQESNHVATTMFLLHASAFSNASLVIGYNCGAADAGVCFIIDLNTYLRPKQ
jgi:hypothetical protein